MRKTPKKEAPVSARLEPGVKLDHIDDDLHREMLRVEAIELGLLPDDDTKITSSEDLRTRWG